MTFNLNKWLIIPSMFYHSCRSNGFPRCTTPTQWFPNRSYGVSPGIASPIPWIKCLWTISPTRHAGATIRTLSLVIPRQAANSSRILLAAVTRFRLATNIPSSASVSVSEPTQSPIEQYWKPSNESKATCSCFGCSNGRMNMATLYQWTMKWQLCNTP